ncbi:MAG: hypothetical protein KBH78_11885 [Candidatus Hydrogenedentes bacterium]|nr:hypothetical protein [Candidatus Hydrogenedentota bacterium]
MLAGITLFATVCQMDTLASSVRDVATWVRDMRALLTDAGWLGLGPGMAVTMLRPDDPWSFPLRSPSWPPVVAMELGLVGLTAHAWLWLMLFRRSRQIMDRGWARAARDALLALFPAMLLLPVAPALFLFPGALLFFGFTRDAARPQRDRLSPPPVPGLIFKTGAYLLVAGLSCGLMLNIFRFDWIARESDTITRSFRVAWTAEQQGRYEAARSGWSDAAWRLAVLMLLDESTGVEDSPATAAVRRVGMDRLLATTPGWFSHPDIRDKPPLAWPLLTAARDAAHFGQARAARALGHPDEALLFLETVARSNVNAWPEILVLGGQVLRETGQAETGDAILRLAGELARGLPALPPWAPAAAISYSRFLASLGLAPPLTPPATP